MPPPVETQNRIGGHGIRTGHTQILVTVRQIFLGGGEGQEAGFGIGIAVQDVLIVTYRETGVEAQLEHDERARGAGVRIDHRGGSMRTDALVREVAAHRGQRGLPNWNESQQTGVLLVI